MGFGFAMLLLLSAPALTRAATFDLTSDKDTFVVGDTFSVDVKINSEDVGINAAQASIKFPQDLVEVASVDRGSSALNFWLQGPDYANDVGTVSFIGGTLGGISGKALEVVHLTFKVKGAGSVGIFFSDGAVTASDGSGTNVLTQMNGLKLTSVTAQNAKTIISPPIVQVVRKPVPAPAGVLPVAPTVSVPLYPDATAWYANTTRFLAQWDLPADVTAVATAIDKDPKTDPTASEGLFNNKTFNVLTDGIWYLHVRFKNSTGWGPTAHYRIGIDTTPPISFSVTSSDTSLQPVAPAVTFQTKDQPSGISGYRVYVDSVLATTTIYTSYTLPAQAPGTHTVRVQAFDRAGNTNESRTGIQILEPAFITVFGIRITQLWFFSGIVAALFLGVVIGWYLQVVQRQRRRRHVIIVERDIQASFGVLKKDIETLLQKYKNGKLTLTDARDMRVMLERMGKAIEKTTQYIIENVEEIEG